jgi:hypothetical protein
VAELGDGIASQIEEREAELGRPLTTAETAGILKALGPPPVAASKYWSRRQLIGPRVLPYYWQTLRIVLWVLLAVNLLALCSGLVTGGSPVEAFARVWGFAWVSFFLAVGVVTVVFVLIERFSATSAMNERWNPATLPRVGPERTVPRFSAVVELVVNASVVLWLLDVPFVREAVGYLFLGPAAGVASDLPFGLAAAWRWGLAALLAAASIQALVSAIVLVRSDWTRLRAGSLFVTNGAMAVLALLIARAQPLVLALPNAGRGNAEALRVANETLFVSVLAAAAICALTSALYLRLFLRLARPPALDTEHRI